MSMPQAPSLLCFGQGSRHSVSGRRVAPSRRTWSSRAPLTTPRSTMKRSYSCQNVFVKRELASLTSGSAAPVRSCQMAQNTRLETPLALKRPSNHKDLCINPRVRVER
ncbi:unnamed protein product [Prorocentrum cordatum]|uniref:Peptide deformylase n=1 Tax=Prorocentrum cordatum TaxID=2364126 RepID=A0ABN9UCT2_9DINO|nr:unnamed protein product [Polarella glacialis]